MHLDAISAAELRCWGGAHGHPALPGSISFTLIQCRPLGISLLLLAAQLWPQRALFNETQALGCEELAPGLEVVEVPVEKMSHGSHQGTRR